MLSRCDERSANKLFDDDHYRRFMITVRHNGSARWQPGGVYSISCALNMAFYPFDLLTFVQLYGIL